MNHILALFGLLDLVIRIGAVFYVPRNRKPSSATAWIMLILLVPFFGLIIFIILGSPKLNKDRRSGQRKMDRYINDVLYNDKSKHIFKNYISDDHNKSYEPFINLNHNLGGLPAFNNNTVKLIHNYDGAIKSIANDMRKAKRFIHIEYFIFVMDDETEVIFKEMESATARGVKVRLMYDAIGNRGYPNMRAMKKRLNEIGVEWCPMLPLKLPGKNFNRPDLRNHRKIVVIDGIYGYTGSQNIVARNYHRRDKLYYDELVVRLKGPVVLQLQAAFMTDWHSETDQLLEKQIKNLDKIEIDDSGSTLAQILPSGPGFDNDNNLKLFTALIHSARKKVVIVNPYFVPEDSLTTAITSAAQRNVEVIMINSKIMDQAMVGYAQRSYFEELLRSGVKIFQYDLPILLHSKFMIIDSDVSVIGSSNLDMRSFQLDLEVTLIAYDSKVASKLHKISENYLKRSHRLYLKTWLKRPLKSKVFENISRLTASIQ